MDNERIKLKRNLMNDKKGLLIRTWVIGFIIFTSIFALLFVASNDMIQEYDKGDLIDEGYRERYDKFDDVVGGGGRGDKDFREIFSDMTEKDGLELIPGITVGLFQIFVTLVKTVFGGIFTLDEIMMNFVEDVGIPNAIYYIMTRLIAMVVVVILLFIIMSSINRGNKI